MTDWARNPRVLIAEAYNPPFYPSLDYKADKAISIAKAHRASDAPGASGPQAGVLISQIS